MKTSEAIRPSIWTGWRSVAVSALDGRGLPELETAIVDLIEAHRLDPGQDLIAINARHAHDLEEARTNIAAAQSKLQAGPPDELLAADLRSALEALGRIGGKVDNEQMLDLLFARFCIGK